MTHELDLLHLGHVLYRLGHVDGHEAVETLDSDSLNEVERERVIWDLVEWLGFRGAG